MRRYRARLGLGETEVVDTIEDVDEGARRVLLVDAIGDDPGVALESLRTVRDRVAHDAYVRLLCPEFIGSEPRGKLRRAKTGGTAVVRMMRQVGWTVVAVERFSIAGYDEGWVDLAAGEVVPRAHGDD